MADILNTLETSRQLENMLARARKRAWTKLSLVGHGFVGRPSVGWPEERSFLISEKLRPNLDMGALLADIAQLPLTHLRLAMLELRDPNIAALRNMTKLEHLELNANELGPDVVAHLRTLPSLRKLSIAHNKLGDEGATALRELDQLVYLSARRNRIHDEGASALIGSLLASAANLEHLDLRSNPIEMLPKHAISSCKPEQLFHAYRQRYIETRRFDSSQELGSQQLGEAEAALAERWSSQRAASRASAIEVAEVILENNLGALGEFELRRLLRQFRTDLVNGRRRRTRLDRQFGSRGFAELHPHLEQLNRWIEALWKSEEDTQIAALLDEAWAQAPDCIPFLTMALHAGTPSRFWVLSPETAKGYERLVDEPAPNSGAEYVRYLEYLRELCVLRSLSPHAVDLLLSIAGGAPLPAESEDETDTDADTDPVRSSSRPVSASTPASVSSSRPQASASTTVEPRPLELSLSLRARGRSCELRLPRNGRWQQLGQLPELGEFPPILDAAELDSLGAELFELLFSSPALAERYRERRRAAREARSSLRIVLELHPDADSPRRTSIADHAWEALRDPDHGRLAIDRQLRLVRQLAKLGGLATPSPKAGALRTLVTFAQPADRQPLDFHREWGGLQQLQLELGRASLLELEVLPRVTRKQLSDRIGQAELLHFAGHGELGALVLEDAGGRSRLLRSKHLQPMLGAAPPRLVVLNACNGSVAPDQAASIAEVFLSRGVTAVVAMSGEIFDSTAHAFADELYRRLAVGEDLESAVQTARWRAYADDSRTWFRPVLWTRCASSFVLARPPEGAELERERAAAEQRSVVLAPRVLIRERVELDSELGPRVRELDASAREALARELLGALPSAHSLDASPQTLEAEVEALLDDTHRVERSLVRARAQADTPAQALREFGESVRRELLPQLGALVGAIGPLATRATASALASPPVQASSSAPAPASSTAPASTIPTYARDSQRALGLPENTTIEALVERARGELELPESLVRRCVAHLLAGRHLVLTGPPGSGKSSLAKQLARAFGYAPAMATANPDWTTFDTIGGLAPTSAPGPGGVAQLSYAVAPGHVLRALDANWSADGSGTRRRAPSGGTWLVIDEMNRAPLDQAFGELFTALVDGELLDPRTHSPLPLPQDFRLIGTTNSADRRLLFEFSEALKRRFAFVEVPAFVPQGGMPPRRLGDHGRLFAQLRTRPAVASLADEGDRLERSFEAAIHALEPLYARLRLLHPLGLAQALDVLTYMLVAEGHGVEPEAEARLYAATCDNLLPALEHLPRARLEALAAVLEGRLGPWLETFAAEAESGYQLDPGARATALELLRALRGAPAAPPPATPEAWAEACRSLQIQASTLHPLESIAGAVATRLAQTLRALCAGADG